MALHGICGVTAHDHNGNVTCSLQMETFNNLMQENDHKVALIYNPIMLCEKEKENIHVHSKSISTKQAGPSHSRI